MVHFRWNNPVFCLSVLKVETRLGGRKDAARRPTLPASMSDADEDLVEASDEEGENITASEVLRRLEEVRAKRRAGTGEGLGRAACQSLARPQINYYFLSHWLKRR